MNAVVKIPHPGGRPREYDRDALAREFGSYIDATEIPIVAEFAKPARRPALPAL
jgi:hypothetical protein